MVLLVLLHVMTGAVVSTTVTFWLQELLLPQASVACHVRVASKVLPQWPITLVTVLRIVMVALPLLSVAVGASKVQAAPCSTVLLVLLHVMTGAHVSTPVTILLQKPLFPRAALACHVPVASKGLPLVMTGAVVSTTVSFCLKDPLFTEISALCLHGALPKLLPQWPVTLVTVLRIVMVALPLLSIAVGASKVQGAPCSTVLLVLLHVMTGAVVSTTVTCWRQALLLPQASVACHVRVASKVLPQWPVTLVTVLRTVMMALPL